VKVREIINATHGKLLSGNAETEIDLSRVSTDTRTMIRGDFFLAISGKNFDGNEFVSDALRKGAIGAIVSKPFPRSSNSKIIIRVRNTTKALQEIAYKNRMKFNIPVIAVTGSNGKTTVKDMIWSILSEKYSVLKNEGTKNNHIGLPETLLRLKPSHDICVLELGTNHMGEIRLLSRIARPDIAVILNIGPSHLEYLTDLYGVFKAKIEMLEYLACGGLLFINGDDKHLSRIKEDGFSIRRFGLTRTNDFRAASISTDKDRIKLWQHQT
jgi:UDP-N-acetylmuramoyl-tripeptide--D-alanyl-D-alanine ligase